MRIDKDCKIKVGDIVEPMYIKFNHDNASMWSVSGASTNLELTDDGAILSKSGRYDGLYITADGLSPNTDYSLEFTLIKLDDNLSTFGGHTDTTFANNTTYFNGVNVGLYRSASSVVDDITNVRVDFKTPSTVVPNHKLYIQPNRGVAKDVKVKLKDVILREIVYKRLDKNNVLTVDELIEIGDLKGNINLISNTNFRKKPQTWNGSTVTINNGIATVTRADGKANYGVITGYDDFIPKGAYTLSFEASTTDVDSFNYCYVMSRQGNQSLSNVNVVKKDGKFYKYSIPINLKSDKAMSGVMIGAVNTGREFKVKNIKLEKGDTATEYSLTPKELGIETNLDKFGLYIAKDKLVCNEIVEV